MKTFFLALLLAVPAVGEDFDRTRPAPPEASRPFNVPEAKKDTLANGVRLAVMEIRRLPVVAVEILLPFAGAALDPERKSGIANFVASMLDEGTATRTGDQFAEEQEGLGSRIAAVVEKDYLKISLFITRRETDQKTLTQKVDETLALAADMIRRPSFPDEAVDRVKEEMLAAIRQAKANPEKLADQWLAQTVFAGHAYGRSLDDKAVEALTRGDLNAFHAERFTPSGAVISVSGDVSVEEARRLAEKHFGSWTGPTPVATVPKLPDPAELARAPGGLSIELIDMPGLRQSSIRLGHPAIARDHPDYFSMIVMNVVLGANSITSRIGRNLREDKGWTYGAKSSVITRKQGGIFVISTEVQTDRTADSVKEILKEICGMQETCGTPNAPAPLSQQEIDGHKRFIAGIFVLAHDTAQSMAADMGLIELLGLPPDTLAAYKGRLEAVTLAQVKEAALKYLHPDKISIVVVGDAKEVRAGLAAIAPVHEFDKDGKPKPVDVQPKG